MPAFIFSFSLSVSRTSALPEGILRGFNRLILCGFLSLPILSHAQTQTLTPTTVTSKPAIVEPAIVEPEDMTLETVAGVNRQTLNKVSAVKVKFDGLTGVPLGIRNAFLQNKDNWRLYAMPKSAQIKEYMLVPPVDNPANFKPDNPQKLGSLIIQGIEVDLNDAATIYLFYEDKYMLKPLNGKSFVSEDERKKPSPPGKGPKKSRLEAGQELYVGLQLPDKDAKAIPPNPASYTTDPVSYTTDLISYLTNPSLYLEGEAGKLYLSKKSTQHLWGSEFDIPFTTDAAGANATLLSETGSTAIPNPPAEPGTVTAPQPEQFTTPKTSKAETAAVTRFTAKTGPFSLFALASGSFSNSFSSVTTLSSNNRDAAAGFDVTLGLFQRNLQAVGESDRSIPARFLRSFLGGKGAYKENLYTVARKDEGLRVAFPVLRLRTTQPDVFGDDNVRFRKLLTASLLQLETTVDVVQVLRQPFKNPLLRLSEKRNRIGTVSLGSVQMSMMPLDFVQDDFNYNFGSIDTPTRDRLRIQRPGGFQGPSVVFRSTWTMPLPIKFNNVLSKPQGEGLFDLQWKLSWQHGYGTRNVNARKFVRGDLPLDFPSLRPSTFRNEFALVVKRGKDKAPVRIIYRYGFLDKQSFYDPFAKDIETHWAFEVGL